MQYGNVGNTACHAVSLLLEISLKFIQIVAEEALLF